MFIFKLFTISISIIFIINNITQIRDLNNLINNDFKSSSVIKYKRKTYFFILVLIISILI